MWLRRRIKWILFLVVTRTWIVGGDQKGGNIPIMRSGQLWSENIPGGYRPGGIFGVGGRGPGRIHGSRGLGPGRFPGDAGPGPGRMPGGGGLGPQVIPGAGRAPGPIPRRQRLGPQVIPGGGRAPAPIPGRRRLGPQVIRGGKQLGPGGGRGPGRIPGGGGLEAQGFPGGGRAPGLIPGRVRLGPQVIPRGKGLGPGGGRRLGRISGGGGLGGQFIPGGKGLWPGGGRRLGRFPGGGGLGSSGGSVGEDREKKVTKRVGIIQKVQDDDDIKFKAVKSAARRQDQTAASGLPRVTASVALGGQDQTAASGLPNVTASKSLGQDQTTASGLPNETASTALGQDQTAASGLPKLTATTPLGTAAPVPGYEKYRGLADHLGAKADIKDEFYDDGLPPSSLEDYKDKSTTEADWTVHGAIGSAFVGAWEGVVDVFQGMMRIDYDDDIMRGCIVIATTYMSAVDELKRYYELRYLYVDNLEYDVGYLTYEITHKYQKMLEMYYLVENRYFFNSTGSDNTSPVTYMLYMYLNILELSKGIVHLCAMLGELEAKYEHHKSKIFDDYGVFASNKSGAKGGDGISFYEKQLKKKRRERKRKRKKMMKLGIFSTPRRNRRPPRGKYPLIYGWSIEDWW